MADTHNKKPTPVNRKALFANNFRSQINPSSDLTLIKERIQLDDGRTVPNIISKVDAQRPFWVENTHSQTYKDKKENRSKDNVQEYWCTQSELSYRVAKALKARTNGYPRIKELARSPYLYGIDCDITVHLKREHDKEYEEKYGEWMPVLEMAVLDYETNMFSADEEIIMGSVTMKDKWLCAVDINWLRSKTGDDDHAIFKKLNTHLAELAKERGTTVEESVIFVNSEIEIVTELFKRLHELSPDVCSIWNIAFDIGKTIEACDRAGVNPADVFCDPNVPEEFRQYDWRPDEQNKQKAGGQSSTKDISDKWHWLHAPCGFQYIDNMCAYRMFRAVEQKLPSYSLDAILQKEFEGKLRKMKFKEAAHVPENSAEWHRFMQKHYPVEYMAYNIFDCVVMEMLDEKIKDISHKLLSYCGITNWRRAKSNPTRLADAYHFFLGEKHNRVLCSTSNKMRHPFDDLTLPKTGWIVTLDNTLIDAEEVGYNPYIDDDGLELIDKSVIKTKIATHVYDIDVSSSYPSNELALNCSGDTTLVEVCSIEGLTLEEHREVCIDLMNARGNSARISETVLGFPNFEELLNEFEQVA